MSDNLVTDDIVTRLRQQANRWGDGQVRDTYIEAADEIERLRGLLADKWSEIIEKD